MTASRPYIVTASPEDRPIRYLVQRADGGPVVGLVDLAHLEFEDVRAALLLILDGPARQLQ